MNAASPPPGNLSSIKLALLAKETRAKAGHVLRSDPIAVIGVGCRVPGGATNADEMWRLLKAGAVAAADVPADRWDVAEWYDRDPAAPGKTLTKEGSFLDRIDLFDAGYFGILPREADRMDPQQRLVLEVAIEAIDDAGLPHPQLRGSRTSVHIASYHNDYAQLQYADPDNIEARTLTGTLHSIVPNRLSYLLDLRGPSLSIDSACSSSLAAIHLGCQGLRSGETDLAIAGGVSLMMTPEITVAMSKVGFMSPDGRCKTFDALADGFGRGEGCGIVVLKRLSDAIADNDRIRAVIRGSAVNQDGRSTLLAAPSGPAQEALIREALLGAQVDAGRVCFFETHGTGTALGDPIEVEAIAATVGRPDESGTPCWLGSAKANFGHLEAAAGVIGLIKAILVLRHGLAPPQPSFTKLNPHISLAGTRLAVPTALTALPERAFPRCAAVSSFGVGGTNANLIVEEAPRLPATKAVAPDDACRILPLSAQSPAALDALVKSWIGFLKETPAAIGDVCHTAAVRRTHYDYRVAVTGRSKDELRARLEALPVSFVPDSGAARKPNVAFVFCGQGPQWFGMGRELFASEARFRDAVAACDALLRPLASWSLLEELSRPEQQSRLAETEIAQPALFAIQVGLAALWKFWGVSPDVVVGHSVGEIAALQVAGALDLPEAIRIVFHRGRIMQRATGNGRMAAVSLDEREAARITAPYGERLGIAAINGPRSVVLSGEGVALDEVVAGLQRRDVGCRMLPVNYAFHSAQMAPLRDEFVSQLGQVRASPPSLPFISTVTGARKTARPDANYFGANLREPVRFSAAATEMLRDCGVVIEIGPHPVLGAAIADCASPNNPAPSIFASLRRGRPERETMLQACAAVYAEGRDVDWRKVASGPGQVVDLPSYPWQRRRHWIPVRSPRASRTPRFDHPLLGRRTDLVGLETSVYSADGASAPVWLNDHRIGDRVLVPAAAEMEAFHAAAARFLGTPVEISGFAIHRPLVLQTSDHWQVVVKSSEAGEVELAWHASDAEAESWRSIANATARPLGAPASRPADPPTTVETPVDSVYGEFRELGAEFGGALQCLRCVERADGFARATLELPPGTDDVDAYVIHPALIDAALQLCTVAIGGPSGRILPASLYLPLGADRIVIHPGVYRTMVARARARMAADGATLVADVWIDAPSGASAMIVEGMRFARAESVSRTAVQGGEHLYRIGWLPIPDLPTEDADVSGTWLIFADAGGAATRLAERLRTTGARTVLATAGDRYRQISADEFALDPDATEDVGRLFRVGGWSEANPLRAVIDCWPLDIPRGEDRGDGRDFRSLGTPTALRLVQALATSGALTSGSLILATRGAATVSEADMSGRPCPRAAGLWGLAATIAIEHPELRVRIVDLDPREGWDDSDALYSECAQSSDKRIALREGRRWAPRLRPYADGANNEPLGVVLTRPGAFDGVDLRPVPRKPLNAGEVRLKVFAAGLNFRDVLLALGVYSGSRVPVGAECAGVVVETGADTPGVAVGDRMFGYAPGSLASEVVALAGTLAPIPAGMPPETAAALPIAFLTALYGLKNIAGLQKGQSVLIHAAAGGVGLAATRIALGLGAEVFATVGSEEKRQLLAAEGVRHVLNSRSLDFADEVLVLTQDRGVDVVLNSLAGEFIPAGLRSLSLGGCFLELGKREIWSPEAVASFRPDVRYFAYDLGEEISRDRTLFRGLMDELTATLSEGALAPLPVSLFPLERVRDAMRFMAQARHIGKIVLTTRAGRSDTAPELVGEGTYWITGGLGALGEETARWLARRGARHIVLSSRHAGDPAHEEFVAEMARSSVDCRLFAADAGDRQQMRAIFDEIRRSLPRLRGVIHAAGVVRDAALINQRPADADAVVRGKVGGAWILHELTRDLSLDFFVLYSAAGVALGAPGQGLYAAANAELDALAQFRHSVGLPATSVAWGPWSGSGMAAELIDRGRDVFAARGLRLIEPELAFARLERLLVDGQPYGAVIPIDWTKFLSQLPEGADPAYFSLLASTPKPRAAVVAKTSSWLQRLKQTPCGLRREALSAELAAAARQVIGLESGTSIALTFPLRELGLDSLMAVELRNVLVRQGGQPLPATLLFDYPHLDALSSHLYRAWGLDFDEISAPAAAFGDDLADLSDAEAEALLLAELADGDDARRVG